jgi:hypothetical protein
METKVITAPEGIAPCRVMIREVMSGETVEIGFAGSPSTESKRLARFVVGVGYRLHRKLLRECPSIRWFVPGMETDASWRGFANLAGRYVALADHLKGRDLVEVCLHELRHCAQRGVRFTDCEAEHDAEGFAHRWTPPTLRAHRATRGQLSRLAVTRSAKPSGWAPHMDIRLTLPTAEVGERDNRTMGDAWRELSCWNEA